MEKEIFEELVNKYAPLVKWIIDSNSIYTNIDTTIRWTFAWDNNPAITATVNRKTNVISINVVFVDNAYNDNRVFDIEYFLLHEMRHVYQHIQIERFKTNNNAIGQSFVLRWIEEGKKYIKSLDENGNENTDYFKQDCEQDAYAFSYAVMNHKYFGRYNQSLFVPKLYRGELKEEFDSAVREFSENL